MNIFKEWLTQREIQKEMDKIALAEHQIYKGFGIEVPVKRMRHVSYYYTRSFKFRLWLFKTFNKGRNKCL